MQFTVQQIADIISAKIEGDNTKVVKGFAKIEEGKEFDLCFLANAKYEHYVYTTQASVIIISDTFELKQPISAVLLRVADAYTAFTKLLTFYNDLTAQTKLKGIEQPSFIHEQAEVHKTAYIAAFAYISAHAKVGENTAIHAQVFLGEHVKVGKNCILYAGVKIYKDCVIGDNCIIHANTVIGADGFGFAPTENGSYKKIPQTGNVVIENDVEIGANSAIDRAVIGSTTIRQGVKLDNLIQIAHNVEIGENTVIAAQTGVAGSTKIGKQCMIGGQVGIVGHIKIADNTKIQAQSGIAKPITEENTAWYGSPAFNYGDFVKSYVEFKNLPNLSKRISEIEKLIKSK